jgi:CheY-like chemotaxis protein
MDVEMPVCDGLEASVKIRDFEREKGLERIPIIAISGYSVEDLNLPLSEVGIDGFCMKPVDFKKLQRMFAGVGDKSARENMALKNNSYGWI